MQRSLTISRINCAIRQDFLLEAQFNRVMAIQSPEIAQICICLLFIKIIFNLDKKTFNSENTEFEEKAQPHFYDVKPACLVKHRYESSSVSNMFASVTMDGNVHFIRDNGYI